jgi:hypothetical protein
VIEHAEFHCAPNKKIPIVIAKYRSARMVAAARWRGYRCLAWALHRGNAEDP